MTKQRFDDVPFLADVQAPYYHEGDVAVINTVHDKCLPSEFIGKYHIHILCNEGKMQFLMSDRVFTVYKGDFAVWTIDATVSEALYSPDFDADILLVSRNFLLENNPQSTWATKGYLYVKENPVFGLSQDEHCLLRSDFMRFKEQLARTNHIFRKEILGKLMQIFLYDLWDVYSTEINRHKSLNTNSANLFSRFLDLVRQKNSESREVAFYADMLCVSPKYLSEVVRKASGKPASYWINGYAIQEIIAMLKRHDLNVSEIAHRMNFYNQSHLSRFVKNMLGVSPTEYRANLENK
ncbi:MAG: helix-turn-helix domain-containing protein [Muribaculaceae bacterium]|nr:helix-turn-helix domain-containing protein [Muribaculaceae bacterium]